MPIPLSVLIVEDMESDAHLIVRLLRAADYEVIFERVETAEQMRIALEKRKWDLIISDYNLSQFDGHAALLILTEAGLDIPFIIVSETVGEETAVTIMKAGAQDYLMKDNLTRFIPAVERELQQAEIRHKHKLAQEQLLLQSSVLNAATDAIVITDRDGVYLDYHAPQASVLLSPPETFFGKNIRDVFPTQIADAFFRVFDQIAQTGQSQLYEYPLNRSDGQHYFEVHVIAYQNGNYLSIIRDITERKLAEKALQESERFAHATVDALSAHIVILDEAGTIIAVNRAWRDFSEANSAMDSALRIYEGVNYLAICETSIGMKPEEASAMVAGIRSVMSGQKKEFSLEYPCHSPAEKRWFNARVTRFPGDGPLKIVVAHENITELKLAEEALRMSEERHRTIIQTAMDGFWLADLQGRLLEVNETYCLMSGYSAQELLTMSISDVEYVEMADDVIARINKIMTQGEDRFESQHHRKDGSTFHVEVRVQYRPTEGGRMVVFLKDISDRKQAEELANQHSQQLSLLYETGQRLNRTLDLYEIYQAICDFMSIMAPNDCLIISAFDPETQLITCRAYWLKNGWLDVSSFPPIPLEAEGKGTQSIVIRTGQAMLINDYQTQVKTSHNCYFVNSQTNEVSQEVPPEEEVTRSALIVPLKSGGKVTGVIQVLSYRLNAYTEDQLKLLEALALHIAYAEQNALLYVRVQAELNERKHAEKSLREHEKQYRTLVEQLPAIVYIDDALVEGCTLYVSPQIETILGFAPQEWQERSPGFWSKQVHPDDRERVEAEYRRCFQYGESFDEEYRISASDGRLLWFRDQAIMLRDENGKPHLIHGVIYDITERKRTEEALHTSEERYRELFNGMIDGFALHEIICDANGKPVDYRFLEVNPAYERLTGLQSEKLIGKTVFEVVPDTEPYWIDFYGNVALTGRPTFFESHSGLLDSHFEVSVYCPLKGQFAVIMVDITERKRAEDALRESEEKYRLIAENTSDGIIIFGADNHIRYASPAYLKQLGYSEVEELTRTPEYIYSVIHPDDRDAVFASIFGAVELKKSGLIYSYRVKHKAGHYVWHEDNATFNYDGSGNYSGSNVVCRDITEHRQAEEAIHQRVTELEMLYQSGLALNQLLNPKEIGQKILELLEQKLGWYHTRIRLYHPQNDTLELLDFNQPDLQDEGQRFALVERFQTLISHSSQGISGWVVQHGQTVRSGDVSNDPRYVEAYSGIRSGLYVPMKLSERMVGVISIEGNQPDAFSEADERLIVTLANQAASAFENARLFEETRQRVMELETLNRISLVLRAVLKQNEMLSIVLDEALAILNTSHGSIELHNKITDNLDQTIMRGWLAQVTAPHPVSEGIAGKVFTSSETYISREFASDPETRASARSQIPSGWGGICLPIHTTQQTLGVMIVSMPSEHELTKDEIRLLLTLSEMTGAALQRMQLHEQTIRRLQQLHALRAVDQAIASSRDMNLTLGVLLTHTISQLAMDAADVLLLQPGSNLLEMVASLGFHSFLFEDVDLSNSIAGRVIIEHRSFMKLDFEDLTLHENPKFEELWKEEGFACYWCVPLTVKGEVKGVLEVYSRTAFTPDGDWLEFLEALAGQAAIAIDSIQLFENLQSANLDLSLAYDATIEGWSRAMDLRDHETEGHTLRVTDLTLKLARDMRINESQLTAIRRGALLHDIGKMGVPDAILLKEGPLTEEEWVLMRKHPQLARDMLSPIAYLNDALDIPYCHHEKWDGTGYPQGLKEDHIPLVARIFAVVDVWDAVTNDRIYRKKWTKQKARQYIKAHSGRHFDPQVVDIFLKNI